MAQNKPFKKPVRGRWFGMILYPDNSDHMKLHEYLVCSGYSLIWINHTGCESPAELPVFGMVSEIPEPRKPHMHVMIHYKNARTVSGVLKSFSGVIKHVEVISDPSEMARYFLHIDFASYMAHKERYEISDVRYTDKALFNSLYSLGTADIIEDYPRVLAEVGFDCMCFPELIKKLYEAGRGDVVLYAMNHSGAVRLLFPHFPYSLNDVNLLKHGAD